MDNSKPTQPRYKKKGLIRTEAVIPFFIVVTLTVAYFTFFFDLQMRKGLEWLGTRTNRAEVNVGAFKTSFLRGTLLIEDIQVTNAEVPSQNKIQISRIQFQFLWDALLRGKFVVPMAAVNGVQTGSPRKTPGIVLPPKPVKEDSGALGSFQSKITEQAKAKLSSSSLGDIGRILEGFDPTKQLKDLGELKSAARIEQLKSELGPKQKEWNQTVSTLANDAELNQIQTKLNGIHVGGSSNPSEIASQISQTSSIITEAQQKVESVQSKSTALTQDVTRFNQSIQELDELVKKDRSEIENKLKLPSVDAKNLAEQLFGPTIMSRLSELERYVALARQYMPAKTASKTIKPKEEKTPRGVGKTYVFGRPNSYPLFWLKKGSISSQSNESPYSGDASGELLDFSTDQTLTGRPALATFQATFPKQGIRDVMGKLTFDHTRDIPQDTFIAKVGTFPVSQKSLSESEDLKFALNSATGSSSLEGTLKGNSVSVTIESLFQKADYSVQAQSKVLESTLLGIVKTIPTVSMKATIGGTLDQLAFSIQSNLASALQKGFEGQLQARLQDARKQIDEKINGKIGAKKKELTDQFQTTQGQITGQIDEKKKKAEGLKSQAQSKLTALQDQSNAIQNKAKDAIKSRLKF